MGKMYLPSPTKTPIQSYKLVIEMYIAPKTNSFQVKHKRNLSKHLSFIDI